MLQVQEWYTKCGKQCRHVRLSRVFDDEETAACKHRCDVCTKERSKFNVMLKFESMFER
jgi:superfamily II DNA helicase RecQ